MNRKTRLLLAVVVLVAIIGMAWFFLISPLRADIAATNTAIAEQQTRMAAAQATLAKAQATRDEGKKNQARLLELSKMVPASSQIPSLLVQIQDLADQAGISFLAVSPGEPMDSNGFQVIPLQLQFSGTYFDLSDFAYRVEQLVAGPGRLLAVKSIQLALANTDDESGSSGTASSPELNVSMTLYAFAMDQSKALATAPTPAATDSTATSNPAGTAAAN